MLRTVCTALLALLVVSGCTDGSAPGASSSPAVDSPSSGSPSASASTRPVVPPAPGRTACYRLSSSQLARPTNDSRPVPCDRRHTSRTVFVGRLDAPARGGSAAVSSAAVRRQLAETCPRKLAAYVGGSARTRDLSRFNVVWFSPSSAQADRGARWFRCDLIAFAGTRSLFDLPRRSPGVRGALDRPGGLDTYGLCGTAAPGSPGFRRVICARPHSWRAFDTVGLTGPEKYPGVEKVRGAGRDECKSRAAARAEDSLRFRYGWEWPSREQWAAGQRFGYCWAPT